jgi:ribosomal protein L34
MLDRVILIIKALTCRPIVIIGRIQQANLSLPVAGSHPRFTEKTKTNNIATQKDGAETPNKEIIVKILSRNEYCLIADTIPKRMPTTNPKTTLPKVRIKVVGYRLRISSTTGRFVL